jgi:hypothetical protein
LANSVFFEAEQHKLDLERRQSLTLRGPRVVEIRTDVVASAPTNSNLRAVSASFVPHGHWSASSA